MAPMHIRLKVALAGVVLSTSIVWAQQGVRPGIKVASPREAARAAAQRSARDIRSLISGVAVDSNQRPLRNVGVRLRNLEMNEVEQIATTNELGKFSFAVLPDIPYVVEIADPAGRIVAVGDLIVANAGEVVGTVVRLPSRLAALAGTFGESASSVISAATGIGVTVVYQALPKVSPTR